MEEKSITSPERGEELLSVLVRKETFEEKVGVLAGHELVPEQFLQHIEGMPSSHKYVLLLLFVLRQQHVLEGWEGAEKELLTPIANMLLGVDRVFSIEGGLLGYQRIVEELLSTEPIGEKRVFPPETTSIQEETPEVRKYILHALQHLGDMCELYPVGGAADRLSLSDPRTKTRLPAAKLAFLDKSLLEGIIDDVKAREYLAYKLFKKQIRTPIGLMTSSQKGNHSHIIDLCTEASWFKRGEDAFFLFSQPLVPCVSEDGKWVVSEPFMPEMKPGGHGMIWLLAQEKKVLHFFQRNERKKILVRQINNPIAGVDYGLLAFMGFGLFHDKGFGFSSCPRKIGAKEGMNVTVENSEGTYLTNLEYCDFEKYGVDTPTGGYDEYPANTNILFADCAYLQKVIPECPLPGKILNFSSKGNGVFAARLETMMQNIADVIPSEKSYITFGERNKTIASAKKAYVDGNGISETPLGALHSYLMNAHTLLTQQCGFSVPAIPTADLFESVGAPFLFSYHPGLGPLYSVIKQKLKGGRLEEGATLKLDIADAYLENIHVSGSLSLSAEHLLGHEVNDILHYSEETGKVYLKDIDVSSNVSVTLKGNSSFVAVGVTFSKDLDITVPHGMVATAIESEWGLSIQYVPKTITNGALYHIDDALNISVSFESMKAELLV